MYNLPYFKEEDKHLIIQFLKNNPFAFLTGSFNNGKQVATQIPVIAEEKENGLFLQGHIMRNTDHHKALVENQKVLVLFTGPPTYVSASGYMHPSIGSTWNYMSVHISGSIRFMNDDELVSFMKKLTLYFENNNTASPAIYDNLPDEFLKKMMPAIVGFEIKAEELHNVFKLSQNRDEKSYRNIIEQLDKKNEKGNAALIADEMRNRLETLFPPGVEWDGNRFLS